MPAACGGRQLAADELLQAKLLLPLNCQMFVQGAENQKMQEMFVQVVDAENRPALLQQLLSSLNRQRFVQGVDAGTWVIAGPVSASNGLRIAEKSTSLSSFFKLRCNMINSFL